MLLVENLFLRAVSLKIPSLMFASPRLVELDDEVCAIRIPLGWRTRNHVGSMYVGVLCAGADLASGFGAAWLVRREGLDVVPVFKDLRAEFLKRADGHVVFRQREGRRVAEAVRQAADSGERITLPVEVHATVPEKYGDDPVARFTLGLSLKRKARGAEVVPVPTGARRAGGG